MQLLQYSLKRQLEHFQHEYNVNILHRSDMVNKGINVEINIHELHSYYYPTPPTCCQQSPAPASCGSQQSLPPGGKERLHFVGIRPEVQARKGGW